MKQRRILTSSGAGNAYADRIKKVDALFRVYRDALVRRRTAVLARPPRTAAGTGTPSVPLAPPRSTGSNAPA